MKRKSILVEYPYSTVADYNKVSEIEEWLREKFGKPGTQAGRKWFWTTSQKKNKNAPYYYQYYNFYFRNPEDVTYFQLVWAKNDN